MRDLAARSIEAKSTEEAYAIAAEALAGDPHDVPFALLYAFDADGESLTMAGQVGLPDAMTRLAPAGEADGDPWSLRLVATTGTPLLLEGLDAWMPSLPGGPWPEPVTQARVMPVTAGMGGRTSGIAVIGIGPVACQTALNIDPGSASNFDPLGACGGTPLISPAKRVGAAQPG